LDWRHSKDTQRITCGFQKVEAVEQEGTQKSQQVIGETEFSAKQAEAFAESAQSMQWTLNKDDISKIEFAAGRIPRDANRLMKECLDVAIPSWELAMSFIVYIFII
jgi:hypothetical protein